MHTALSCSIGWRNLDAHGDEEPSRLLLAIHQQGSCKEEPVEDSCMLHITGQLLLVDSAASTFPLIMEH
jgi:hypothetical protein